MLPNAVIIQTPNVDFGAFLGLAREALGYNPAARLDASAIERGEAERFISCLAAIEDRTAQPGLTAHLLDHATVSVLVAADLADALEIEAVAAMPCVTAETKLREVRLLILTGSLGQWKRAVLSGSIPIRFATVRACFNRIMTAFVAAGLNLWKDCKRDAAPDGTLLLEDKR